jgi:uncharacterized membrane protein YtjA (UPF0391 family)
MLSWAITFLVIALIAAVLGFGGIAGTASSIAQILFVVFLVLFIVSLIAGRRSTPLWGGCKTGLAPWPGGGGGGAIPTIVPVNLRRVGNQLISDDSRFPPTPFDFGTRTP